MPSLPQQAVFSGLHLGLPPFHPGDTPFMSTLALLGIGAGSIGLLLLLIIRWQVHAFVAMMLVSFLVAFATGMPIGDIISTLIAGMGGTLGSVAILVALRSMLGRMI